MCRVSSRAGRPCAARSSDRRRARDPPAWLSPCARLRARSAGRPTPCADTARAQHGSATLRIPVRYGDCHLAATVRAADTSKRGDSMRLVSTFAALSSVVVVGSVIGATPASPGPGEPTLAEVRKLTERFQDVNTALAEGYLRDPFDLCDTA